jgi:hypothetical protein
MKYEMTRDDLYAINQIAESLNSRNDSDDDSPDYYIYWPLLELVKTALTESARDKSQVVYLDSNSREVLHDEDELGEAIRIVADRVNQYLIELDLEVDLELYFDWIKKKLEWPAKTITGKGDLLRIEKERLSVATGLVINLSHGIQADLTKIGMADSVEGLYLKPKTLSDGLNLDALRSRGDCEIVGDWYPYDVQGPNGLAFVVDDDHSIFVSTRGMDETTQAECQDVLIEIANMLFAT